MTTLKERIEAAASDMGFDGDESSTGGDHLLEFLNGQRLTVGLKEGLGSHASDLAELRVVQKLCEQQAAALNLVRALAEEWETSDDEADLDLIAGELLEALAAAPEHTEPDPRDIDQRVSEELYASDLDKATARVAELEHTADVLSAGNQTLANQLAAANARVAELERDLAQCQRDLATCADQRDEWHAQIVSLRAEVERV